MNAFPHLSGRMDGEAHILPIRVYYEDTDFSGFAYHASYLRFFERGRTELIRCLGISQADLFTDLGGFAFVVRRMTIDFLRPARMDDILTIATRPIDMRGASMRLAQEAIRNGEILATAEVTVAAIRNGRAIRLPDELRSALSRLMPIS